VKYVYGPVLSWRLGTSLGVDLISSNKACSFECIYCQLGKGEGPVVKRSIFVPTKELISELESLPPLGIDYITLSGCGEPTLAANLGEVLSEIKKRLKQPIAVLTNSTLMQDEKVCSELSLADKVIAKLDVPDEKSLEKINQPAPGITFAAVLDGIKRFAAEYPKKLALQIMFVSQNKEKAAAMAQLAKEINPIEVYLNTPLRESDAKPLSANEMQKIKKLFFPLKVVGVYDKEKSEVIPMEEDQTEKRRPRRKKQ